MKFDRYSVDFMDKFAFDIVLLFDGELQSLIFKLNRTLVDSGNAEIDFSNSRIPHISLLMGGMRSSDLDKVDVALEKIAVQNRGLSLTATGVSLEKTWGNNTVSHIDLNRTDTLQQLHENVVNGIKPSVQDNITQDLFADDEINELTMFWVNNYASYACFEKFNPHITIGFGELTQPKNIFPFEFKPKSIAVCHLGNNCTCKHIISEHYLTS